MSLTFSYLVVGMRLAKTLGQKGQLVIPKVVRDFLGIKPGDVVVIEVREKEVLIRPGMDPERFVGDFCSLTDRKLTEKVDLERLLEEEVEERFALR